MKQTILKLSVGCLFLAFTYSLGAQTMPKFQSGAYQVIENASHTHFDWAANESEYLAALEAWANCGPNISILTSFNDSGYHLEMIVKDQIGPEYVAKLLAVVGITRYSINGTDKELSQLEIDLQAK